MEPDEREPERPLILAADDDPALRALYERALSRGGLDVVVAADGQEAIEELDRRHVEVVLLDLHMPVLDGLAALRLIRADPRHRAIPIILVTGSAAESELIQVREHGADDYIAKPFAIDHLLDRVRHQLRGGARDIDAPPQ